MSGLLLITRGIQEEDRAGSGAVQEQLGHANRGRTTATAREEPQVFFKNAGLPVATQRKGKDDLCWEVFSMY